MDSGAAASVRDIRQQEVITKMVINHTLSHPQHLSIREKRGFQAIALVKLVTPLHVNVLHLRQKGDMIIMFYYNRFAKKGY